MNLYGIEIDESNEEKDKKMFFIANSFKIIINTIVFIFFYKFFNYFGIPLYISGEFKIVNIFNLEYSDEILKLSLVIFIITIVIKSIYFLTDNIFRVKEGIVIFLRLINLYLFSILFYTTNFWNTDIMYEISRIVSIEPITNISITLLIKIVWFILFISTIIQIGLGIFKILSNNKSSS